MRRQFRFSKVIVAVAVLVSVALVYVFAALAEEAEPGVARAGRLRRVCRLTLI